VILAKAEQLQLEARNLRGLFMRLLLSLSTLFAGAVLAAFLPLHSDDPGLARAKSAEADGRFEEATQQYQTILKGTPSLVEARLGLGRSLANLARCEQADKVLQGIAAPSPLRAEAETVAGNCYFLTHDYQPAISHLQEATRLDPKAKQSWVLLSRCYAEAGAQQQAIETLKRWLARNGDDVDVLFWMGKFYEEAAETTFQKMAEAHPNSYLIYQAQAEQYIDNKDYKKALEALDRAQALAPDAPGLHYSRGDVYWSQRALDKAQAELEKELRSNPFHAQANWLLGDIYVSLREPEKGIPYLERAVALNPGLWDAHRALGRALVMENKIQKAVGEFQIVAKANPDDDSIHGLLSNAYRRLGDLEKAKEEAEVFEKLNAARRERVPKPSVNSPPVTSAPE
jgi:tetratricopeptide (TPR) repeat protein